MGRKKEIKDLQQHEKRKGERERESERGREREATRERKESRWGFLLGVLSAELK